MGIKYQNEADAWQQDKARCVSGEWTRETLITVTIWRLWNNVDVARRTRGKGAQAGAQNQQKRTWRTIAAAKVVDGGLDAFDLDIAKVTVAWLDEHNYTHKPERDTSGGDESVEFFGTTIEPLWPSRYSFSDRLAMPNVLKKKKRPTETTQTRKSSPLVQG